MTIAASDLISLLLEAAPGARHDWDAHLQRWNGESAGLYNDVTVFAQHLVDSHARGDMEDHAAIFTLVELVLTEGDEEAVALATWGLLEDIQTLTSHHSFGTSAFTVWLGPRSGIAWQEIAALWADSSNSLSDVIRRETRRQLPET